MTELIAWVASLNTDADSTQTLTQQCYEMTGCIKWDCDGKMYVELKDISGNKFWRIAQLRPVITGTGA